MKKKTVIKPKKPILLHKPFEYTIELNKNQVDYSDLKNKKEIKNFREQTYRHITIINDTISKKIEQALNKFSPSEKKMKITEIKSILKKLQWEYSEKQIYLIEKKAYIKNLKINEHRKSYIRVIEIPDIKIFYHELNTILKTHIPTQFPHITLYTKGEHPNRGYFGISISSKSAFKKLNPKKIK